MEALAVSFTGLLTNTCTWYTVTETAGTYAQPVYTPAAKEANIPCRARLLSSTERDVLKRNGVDATWRVYCDVSGRGFSVKDQLQVTGIGTRLEIVRIEDPDLQEIFFQIDARELR